MKYSKNQHWPYSNPFSPIGNSGYSPLYQAWDEAILHVHRRFRGPDPAFPRSGLLTLRKFQKPLAFQPFQKVQTLAAFESAIGSTPFQQFAHRMRQFCSTDPSTGLDHFPDQRNLFPGKLPATESLTVSCGDHASPPLPFSHNKEMGQGPAKNDHFRKKILSSLSRAIALGGPRKRDIPSPRNAISSTINQRPSLYDA
jgi:hypothetical protein